MMDGNDMYRWGAEAGLGTQHVRSAGKRSGPTSDDGLVSSVAAVGNVHGHTGPSV
ncbi:unnamed protein product, partial [Urochloa humidicola]